MKKNILLFTLCSTLLCAAFSCDKSDDPLDSQKPEDASGIDSGSKSPISISPEIKGEALAFVGKWKGKGPGYTTIGTWTFHNDGTFEWYVENSYGYSKSNFGNWHYLSDKKMLITEPKLETESWSWEIVDVTPESWTGACLNGGGTYTYTKVDITLDLTNTKVVDYIENGLVVRTTIKNYNLYNNSLKTGICYGLKNVDNPEEYQKVYASKIDIEITDENRETHSDDGNLTVRITGLETNGKYNLCGFIEFEDGTIIYGEPIKALCIKKPDTDIEVVYMGGEPVNGYIYLWATKDLNTDGTMRDPLVDYDSDIISTCYVDGFDNAIKSLGENWELPSAKCFDGIISDSKTEKFSSDFSKAFYGVKIRNEYNGNILLFNLVTAMMKETNGRYYSGKYSYLLCDKSVQDGKNYRSIGSFFFYSEESKDYDDVECRSVRSETCKVNSDGSINESLHCRPVYKVKAVW